MQNQDKQVNINRLSNGETATNTVTIRLLHWHETIVAHYSQDERLQAFLEQPADFYERVSALALRKSVSALSEEERELGHVLVKATCGCYGKRFVAGVSGITPLEAQKLLNQFNAVFHKARSWLKAGNQDFAHQVVRRIIYSAIERCCANLPQNWHYLSELTFSVPAYYYDKQVEKFFRHHFESELEICGEVVRLPVGVEIG